MSTAVTSGTSGTLAQRRGAGIGNDPVEVVLNGSRQTARRRSALGSLRGRVRYSLDQSFVWRVLSAITAVLSILGMLTIVGSSISALDSGAHYRTALFGFHGFLAMMTLSAVVDQELFDIRTALLFSVLALAVDVFLAIVESIRHFGCPNGDTQLDIGICLDSPTRSLIVAIVSISLAALALLNLIFVALWHQRRVREIRAIARLALLNRVADGTLYRRDMDAQIVSRTDADLTARQRRIARSLRSAGGIFRAVVGVLLLVAVVFIAILNLLFFRAGFLYRGALLIVPAHLAGALFGFFGTEPNWWRWLTLVFAVLSLASALTASIVEFPRYLTCANGGVFTKQIEADICAQDGLFLAAVWPITSLVVGLLSILAGVAVVLSPAPRSRTGAVAVSMT